MSVALSVAFTGLCALVTGGNNTPGEVLLVDAPGVGEVRGMSLPQHAPTLVVSLRELANADSSSPTRVVAGASEQIGLWDLTGSEVRIRTQGGPASGMRLYRRDDHASLGPGDVQDPLSWRDIENVPIMERVAGTGIIDPTLVGSIDSVATQLPRQVAARIFLDGGLLEGALPSHESFRSKVFEFRRGADSVVRQPLTDTARWTVESDASAVVIDITPVGGGRAKRLLFAPSTTPHQLFVSNLPAENPSHDHAALSEEEMNAVHFGAYYKLLLNPPDHQPVPMVWNPATRNGTGFVDGGFCPGALFSRK